MPITALDLCCGYKTVANAWTRRGWRVQTLDILRSLDPTWCCDVREFDYLGPPVDVVWASPPCIEYSRESMPWCRRGVPPDLSIWQACERVIAQANPRFYIVENVKGAVRWHGPPAYRNGAYHLWGVFPWPAVPQIAGRKSLLGGSKRLERAAIPMSLTTALAVAIEAALSPDR